jgi:hypothetical protein
MGYFLRKPFQRRSSAGPMSTLEDFYPYRAHVAG